MIAFVGHQDSRQLDAARAERTRAALAVARASNFGSHDSIEMKKPSSVTRSKTVRPEERMVEHRQLVEAEHAEDGAERAAEHRELEGDGDVRAAR